MKRAAFVLGLVVLASIALPAVGASADGIGQFSFEPSTTTASPGETFTVDVMIRSTPQFTTGVYRAGVVAQFDPQYVKATDIENGTFMDPEKGTLNQTAAGVNNQDGFVVYEMKYNSSDTGVNGRGTFLTITFEVKENAPTGSFEFSVYQSRIVLTDGMSQQVMTSPATMTIEEHNTQTSTVQSTTTQQSGNSLGSAGAIVAVGGILSLFVGMLLVVRKL